MMRGVPSRVRATDRATAVILGDVATLGAELRTARLIVGRSQRDVGRAAGVTGQHVGRVERGRMRRFDARTLARLGAVLGLEVRVRAFPAGPSIRDAGQASLLRRVRVRLGPVWSWHMEVRVESMSRRAWDATATLAGLTVAFEAETRLYDLQAQMRRIMAKWAAAAAPDSAVRVDRLVLVVGSTRHNRAVLASERELLRGDFPLDSRAIASALSRGRDPGANGIIII